MKKLLRNVCLIALVISTVFSAVYVSAEDTDGVKNFKNNMTTLKTNGNQKMIDALEKGINSNANASKTVKSYSVKNAYLAIKTKEKMLEAYRSKKSMEYLMTDEKIWIVPIVNEMDKNGYAVLTQNGNSFTMNDVVITENSPRLEVSVEDAVAIVEGNAKGDVSDMGIYYSELYKTTMIYWQDTKGKYIVPYTEYEKECKVKNGRLYTMEEYFKGMNKIFSEGRYREGTYKLPYKLHLLRYIIIFVILVVAIFFGVKALKRYKFIRDEKRRMGY